MFVLLSAFDSEYENPNGISLFRYKAKKIPTIGILFLVNQIRIGSLKWDHLTKRGTSSGDSREIVLKCIYR